MTIIFEPFSTLDGVGEGVSRLSLRHGGIGFAIDAGRAIGASLLALGHAGIGQAFDPDVEPELPAYGWGTLAFSHAGTAAGGTTGSGQSHLVLSHGGLGIAADQALGASMLVLAQAGYDLPLNAGYGFSVQQPGEVVSWAGIEIGSAADAIAFSGTPDAQMLALLRESLAAQGDPITRAEVMAALTEAVTFSDAVDALRWLLVVEGVAFGEEVVASPAQIARVVETLLLTGQVTTYVEAIDTLVVGLAFGALASGMQVGKAEASMVTSETITETVTRMLRLVESLLIDGAASGVSTLTAVVTERMLAGVQVIGAAEIYAILREGVSFVTRLSIDNGEYIAWVLNTESRGLSRYTNWPFNSYARIGNTYFAADSTGVHRLAGDTDNGEAIKLRIRAGLSDLGTRRLKRIPDAYVAYAGGSVYLKVISVSEDGEKAAAIYQLADRPAGATRENRRKIGRGIVAIDWDFELEAVTGEHIDLKQLEFRPLILDRRTRG